MWLLTNYALKKAQRVVDGGGGDGHVARLLPRRARRLAPDGPTGFLHASLVLSPRRRRHHHQPRGCGLHHRGAVVVGSSSSSSSSSSSLDGDGDGDGDGSFAAKQPRRVLLPARSQGVVAGRGRGRGRGRGHAARGEASVVVERGGSGGQRRRRRRRGRRRGGRGGVAGDETKSRELGVGRGGGRDVAVAGGDGGGRTNVGGGVDDGGAQTEQLVGRERRCSERGGSRGSSVLGLARQCERGRAAAPRGGG